MRYSAPQYAKVLLSLLSEVSKGAARETMRTFFKTLASHGALSLLPEIVREVASRKDREKNVRRVLVRSAERVSELSVKRKLHFKAEVRAIKDTRVFGGAVVESGDLRVDNSIAMRLERIRQAFTR